MLPKVPPRWRECELDGCDATYNMNATGEDDEREGVPAGYCSMDCYRDRQKSKTDAKKLADVKPVYPSKASAGKCEACKVNDAHHWHHWLPQSVIRTYVKGRRDLDLAAKLRVLRVLLSDRANYSRFCDSCHMDSEAYAGHGKPRRFRRDQVKPSAWAFAARLGKDYAARLERLYIAEEVAA
jgi:hypothetical protein